MTKFARSASGFRRIVLGLLLFLPLTFSAQANDLADRLIRAYSALESYCDRGKHFESSAFDGSRDYPRTFERCILQDGTYRTLYGGVSDPGGIDVKWTDTRTYYQYDTLSYRNRIAFYRRGESVDGLPGPNSVPPILAMALSSHPRWIMFGMPPLKEWLDTFEVRADLSSDSLLAYESPESDRIWISRDDGLIRRIAGSVRYGGLDVTEVRVNERLSAADLQYQVPIATLLRYEATGNTAMVVVTISLVSLLLGLVCWRRQSHQRPENELALRAKGWEFYSRIAIGAAAALLYGLFTSMGGDRSEAAKIFGHFDWLALYVYLLWLVALFRLAMFFSGLRKRVTLEAARALPLGTNANDGVAQITSRIMGLPAIATMAGSAIAFFFAITQGHRYSQPSWVSEWPEMVVPDTLYLNAIVGVVCVLGLGLVAEWLHRVRNMRLILTVLLIGSVFSIGLLSYQRNVSEVSLGSETGVPFDWMYGDSFRHIPTRALWSAFVADVLVGLFLAGITVFLVDRCIRKKIRWPAISVMVLAMYAAYGLNIEYHGGHGEGWHGMPFTSNWWMDMGGAYTKYSALNANIAVALVCVASLMFITEWLHRLKDKAVVASIVIVSAGLSVVLILWRTRLLSPTGYLWADFYGMPFRWSGSDGFSWSLSFYPLPALLGDIAVAYFSVGLLGFAVHFVAHVVANKGAQLEKPRARRPDV